MSNLDKLIEWMESSWTDSSGTAYYVAEEIIIKAKQLQKEEPKTYTQEEMDKAIEQAWIKGQQSMLEF